MTNHGTPSLAPNDIAPFVSTGTKALILIAGDITPEIRGRLANSSEEMQRTFKRALMPPTEQVAILRPTLLITIPQVPVNYGPLNWNDRINQAGPNTGADWDIRKVGDLWIAERAGRTGIVPTNITLVGFGQDVGSEQVLDFAVEWNFGRAMNPYEAFTLPAHRPNLHRELGRNEMAAVSLMPRDFLGKRPVCGSWWGDGGRGCDLDWFGLDWLGNYVFGFVSES